VTGLLYIDAVTAYNIYYFIFNEPTRTESVLDRVESEPSKEMLYMTSITIVG